MCGRFFTLSGEENVERVVFPTNEVEVLMRYGWRAMAWGFPKPVGSGVLINARAETVMEKPTFRDAFAQRRCLVPADGYFEWQRRDGRKTKARFRLKRADGARLMMAGLYNEQGRFVILTQPPNSTVAPLHDRMPVILTAPELQTLWLQEDGLAALVLQTLPDVALSLEEDMEEA